VETNLHRVIFEQFYLIHRPDGKTFETYGHSPVQTFSGDELAHEGVILREPALVNSHKNENTRQGKNRQQYEKPYNLFREFYFELHFSL
jgi:hypothetical protein